MTRGHRGMTEQPSDAWTASDVERRDRLAVTVWSLVWGAMAVAVGLVRFGDRGE